MFIKIPFESDIPFKTNISEITKMSLEHDYNINDSVVLGNFYISGEYRAHEVSVNREPFNYTLPFSVELRDDIIKDSLEFNIEDFSYEIMNNNILKVNVEYSLKGEILEKEELFERVNEEELESELAYIDNFLDDNIEEVDLEEKKEVEEVKKIEEIVIEEKNQEINPVIDEKIKNEDEVNQVANLQEEKKDYRISMQEEKTIMDTIKNSDDTFVTYHIHIVKESESLESISALYNVPNSLINEYNNTDNVTIGDKILIPKIDE